MKEKHKMKKLKMKNHKRQEKNQLESPFAFDQATAEANFDEEKIREKLKEIMPEKDHYLIEYIIKDKQYFPNNLDNEVGVFRDNKGNLLEIFHGKKDGFDVPLHLVSAGTNEGFSIISHNHMNGLVTPSPKDMASILSLQSNYSPIYSPNKLGLLVNSTVAKNKEIREEISNKYDKFIEDKELKIQNLFSDKTKKIKDNFHDGKLEKKILNEKLYRPYFVENQEQIANEINSMFRENNFDMKLYIL